MGTPLPAWLSGKYMSTVNGTKPSNPPSAGFVPASPNFISPSIHSSSILTARGDANGAGPLGSPASALTPNVLSQGHLPERVPQGAQIKVPIDPAPIQNSHGPDRSPRHKINASPVPQSPSVPEVGPLKSESVSDVPQAPPEEDIWNEEAAARVAKRRRDFLEAVAHDRHASVAEVPGFEGAPDFRRALHRVTSEKALGFMEEMRARRKEKYNKMSREKTSAAELVTVELELERKNLECKAIDAKIARLRENLRFIENDWVDDGGGPV